MGGSPAPMLYLRQRHRAPRRRG